MTSPKRFAANRANARKSTGPKSSAGKTRTRMNALSSGFFALSRVLPGESQADYDNLSQSVIAELEPRGAVEQVLVDHIISDIWRLRRLERAENSNISADILVYAKHRHYKPTIQTMREDGNSREIAGFLKNAPDPECIPQDVDQVLGKALSRWFSFRMTAELDRIRTAMMRRIVQNRMTLEVIQERRLAIDSEAAVTNSNQDFATNGNNERDHYLT